VARISVARDSAANFGALATFVHMYRICAHPAYSVNPPELTALLPLNLSTSFGAFTRTIPESGQVVWSVCFLAHWG